MRNTGTETTNELLGLQKCLNKIKEEAEDIKEEAEQIKNHAFDEIGFLFRHYKLNYDAVDRKNIQNLKGYFQQLEQQIEQTVYDEHKYRGKLQELEQDFNARYDGKYNLIEELEERLEDAEHRAQVGKHQCEKLLRQYEKSGGTHSDEINYTAKHYLDSIEKHLDKILKLASFLSGLVEKREEFSEESYYPSPHKYGRAMSKEEYKKTKRKAELVGNDDEKVSVFHCPDHREDQIRGMSHDERRELFSSMGVENPSRIVLFTTDLVPEVRDVWQRSSAIREAQFISGIHIEIFDTLNV